MEISEIYVSQRKLRCVAQLPAMIATLDAEDFLPPITLSRSEDGSIQIEDGHHSARCDLVDRAAEIETTRVFAAGKGPVATAFRQDCRPVEALWAMARW